MRPLDGGLGELLAAGVAAGAFPAAAAWVAHRGAVVASAAAGPVRLETLWDVASLTKPMVVGSLAMAGVSAGWLSLDEGVAVGGARPSVASLLAHRSGLPAWLDLAAGVDARLGPWREGAWRAGEARVRAQVEELIAEAAGDAEAGTVYSDLGYIALGWHLEARLGAPLRRLVPGYRPVDPGWPPEGAPPPDPEVIAPTGPCPFRGRELVGEVHDLNTWVLGGAAGHAGVFVTAAEVGAWALGLARAAEGAPGPVDGGVVRAFWEARRQPGSTWALGWDSPTPGATSAGSRASGASVGHLGFTGTSVWIDREARLITILLTNRVALGDAAQPKLRAFRPRFHDAVRDLVQT